MTFRLENRRDKWGMAWTHITCDGECQCGEPATIAHTVMEVVAMTLAEPLRKALDDHLEEHREAHERMGGFIHCPEAKRLWGLLPDGDRIVLA